MTVKTITVPLWKATPGGGAQNTNFHKEMRLVLRRSRLYSAIAEIHGDFKTNAQIFKGWFGPHGDTLRLAML